MAEQLGEAVLKLTLDTKGLEDALQAAKRQIETELGGPIGRTTRQARQAGGGRRATSGGARENARALEIAQEKRFRLAERINRLEDQGVDVARLRLSLGRLTEAQSRREFGTFRQRSLELSRQIKLTERRAQLETRVSRADAQAAARGARAGGASESLFALERAQDRRFRISQRINRLEDQGVDVGRLRNSLGRLTESQSQRLFGTFRQQSRELERQLSLTEARYRREQQIQRLASQAARRGGLTSPIRGGAAFPGSPEFLRLQAQEGARIGRLNASPVRGGLQFPGSPIALEAAARNERRLAAERERSAQATARAAAAERRQVQNRRRDVAANALIGAGFPLLFGQGFGAAAGGALGGGLGALGGGTFGFAGSIAGTAIGAAFDTALQKAQELAAGLDDPIKNFEALRQAALLSSRAVEKNAEALIAAGREEEAAALLRGDLERTFGSAEAAQNFRNATDELNRSWSQATVTLAGFVAGPLADFLNSITLAFGGGPVQGAIADTQRTNELISSNPQLRRQFEQLAAQRGLQFTGPNLEVNSRDLQKRVEVVREFLKSQNELTAAQRTEQQQANDVAAASQRTLKANQLNLDIIDASARGNRLQALDLERRLALLQEERRLGALPRGADPVLADTIRTETAQKLRDIDEKRASIQQELNNEAFAEAQARSRVERSISNTAALLLAQRGTYRDTLRTIQQITTSIEEARAKEAQLGFQIGQARIGGREEEASRLVQQQQTAATETRQRLIEGALALTEAGESLRDNLRQATLEFTAVRSDPQGLNRFLGQNAINRRAQQDLQLLLPQFRAAQQQFQQLTGTRAPEFTGRTDLVNAQVRDFIDRVTKEREAALNLAGAQQSLAQVNTQLVAVNTQLATATQALAAKDWTVNVQVNNQAGGASTVQTLNGLAQ